MVDVRAMGPSLASSVASVGQVAPSPMEGLAQGLARCLARGRWRKPPGIRTALPCFGAHLHASEGGCASFGARACPKSLSSISGIRQPGMDRVWGTGQSVGLPPHALDSLQRMAFQAPGCEKARLVPAPVWSDGLFQVYRIQCEGGTDRILKLLLPGAEEAVDFDLSGKDCESVAAADPILRRSWDGLMGELRYGLRMELDIPREIAIAELLRKVFPDRSEGIWIPVSYAVSDDGLKGIVLDAADGFALSPYFSYLRETRRPARPQGRAHSRLPRFCGPDRHGGASARRPAISAHASGSFFPGPGARNPSGLRSPGPRDIRVLPGKGIGWNLSMSDFSGAVRFPDWCAHALREWDVVCPEGSDDLLELCRAMGWQENQLQVLGRDGIASWSRSSGILFCGLGSDTQGFAFEDWRLDGRLASLLGQGHQHETWPIPDSLPSRLPHLVVAAPQPCRPWRQPRRSIALRRPPSGVLTLSDARKGGCSDCRCLRFGVTGSEVEFRL